MSSADIDHAPLECGWDVSKTEGYSFVSKSVKEAYEGGFFLIFRYNQDLVEVWIAIQAVVMCSSDQPF